jgi:DNA-binding NarL/FixJ family response regulator
MKKRKKPVFYILEENPVYLEIIPKCLDIIVPDSQITTFVNPHDMLSALTLKPDLLISEYSFSIPGYNGYKILQLVKKRSPKTRVIFFTAHDDIVDAINSIRAGAIDYIPKSKTALDTFIRKLLFLKEYLEYMRKSDRTFQRLTALLIAATIVLAGLVVWYQVN